ncbi:MAG: hypothetical protein KTR24_16845 [Saprospiraceae bacterium]|nr:hypothetical protein [Saprospiraceae bacterium]
MKFVERILDPFRWVANLGLSSSVDPIERIKIRMLNQQTLIVIILCAFFSARSIGEADFWIACTVLFLTILILVLSAKKKHFLARIYWAMFYPSLMVATAFLYGAELRIEYVFVHFILMIFIFFESRLFMLLSSIYVCAMYLLSIHLTSSFINPYADVVKWYDKTLIFIVSVGCTSVLIWEVYGGMKQYLRLHQEKVQELGQMNQELLVKTTKLEDSNRRLEQYAYLVSHDLKTPLRSITGFAALLTRKVKSEVPDLEDKEIETYAQYLSDGVAEMNKQIEDLLQKSR